MFFVQLREKLTHGLLNFFEKFAKTMHFCYFLKKFFENFRKFSGVGGRGSAPGPPKTPTPEWVPPEPKSWRRRWDIIRKLKGYVICDEVAQNLTWKILNIVQIYRMFVRNGKGCWIHYLTWFHSVKHFQLNFETFLKMHFSLLLWTFDFPNTNFSGGSRSTRGGLVRGDRRVGGPGWPPDAEEVFQIL